MKYLKGEDKIKGMQYIEEAAIVAKKALCYKAKCGSVIVANDKIIGNGYNAPPLDDENHRRCGDNREGGKPKYDQTCCVHAEWRAMHDALVNNADKIVGSKLYFTRVDEHGRNIRSGQPYCTVCSRLALDLGLSKFILYHEDGICEYDTDEYDRLSYNFKSG